jgi:hypothetical protein
MPLESPVSVLFASTGVEVAVSSSTAIASSTVGFLAMASGSTGAQFLKIDSDGALVVSGNFSATSVATQSVQIAGWDSGVTGSVYSTILGTPSVSVTNLPTTQSIYVGGWAEGVTGSVYATLLGSSQITVVGTASVLNPGAINTNVSSAAASLTSYTMLPLRPTRRGATFWKEGTNICYLSLADVASTSQYTVRLSNNGYYEVPFDYIGPVSVIFSNDSAGNSILVTEITGSI